MISTFYSFKGGVGRSMALANIAELLYRQGEDVLIIDFDLEAPGIEDYFDVENAIFEPNALKEKRGLLDMLLSYKEMRLFGDSNLFQTTDEAGEKDFPHPIEPIANFITQIYEDPHKGSLSIIPAGKRTNESFGNYAENVRSFDWNDFYQNWDGEIFFEWFRKEVSNNASFVLIDSRTGVTEISGVCTHQLADLVVIFVSSNKQNLDGAEMVAESLSNPEFLKEGRKNRPLPLLFVPSRIEDAESDLLDQFATKFKSKFEKYYLASSSFGDRTFEELTIPYVARYAYMEAVAVRDYPKRAVAAKLYKAFSNLATVIISKVKEVKIEREFTENNLELYELKLSQGRKLLSKIIHGEYGRDSLAEVLKVVDLYKEVAGALSNQFGEESTRALTALSNYLHENGAPEAIQTLSETIGIQKQTVNPNGRANTEKLAKNLFDLANWLIEIRNYRGALIYAQEAAQTYRTLQDSHDKTTDADLANSLIILSECLFEKGDLDNAQKSGMEALSIYRSLYSTSPATYEIETAKSFNALLDIISRSEISYRDKTLEIVLEAEEFFRNLAELNHKYEEDLAKILNMLAESLFNEGAQLEAIEKQEEAIQIFERLISSPAITYKPDLASGYINLSRFLLVLDPARALESAQRASYIYSSLNKERPNSYLYEYNESVEIINNIKSNS